MTTTISEKSELLDALTPVLWLTWFSGNSLRSTKKHSKKLMEWFMTTVDFTICLSLVIYAIQLKHVFKIPERNSCKFLIGVSVQLFYTGVALRSCIGLWRKSTSGLHFMTLLESYELKSNRKLISKLKRSNSYLLIASVALLLVTNSLLALFFLTLVIPKDSILVKVLMLTHHGTDTFAFEVFGFSLLSFSVGCGHLSQLCLLLFFSRLVCYEFSTILRKFRQAAAQDLASEIELIRGEYEQVIRLVAAVDDLLSFNLLFVFSAMVPTTCIFLYTLIQQNVEEIDLSVIGAMAFTAVIECVLIVSLGIRINKKAHELTDDLYNVDMTNMPSDVISKLSIFLTRLTASPIGISVAGLFIIDNSTILMLAGTLLTYVVVVIQTKPSNSKCCLSEAENCTFI